MSSPLLLAEELFLLAHDDESGNSGNTMGLSNGLAGAQLLDLAPRGEPLVTSS
ncbi:MAG: GPP34 family phosphoprotein [Actinomycetota bacterium]|nr:GPP34 family phosphoprotein [Actinomycetota bacterium]